MTSALLTPFRNQRLHRRQKQKTWILGKHRRCIDLRFSESDNPNITKANDGLCGKGIERCVSYWHVCLGRLGPEVLYPPIDVVRLARRSCLHSSTCLTEELVFSLDKGPQGPNLFEKHTTKEPSKGQVKKTKQLLSLRGPEGIRHRPGHVLFPTTSQPDPWNAKLMIIEPKENT